MAGNVWEWTSSLWGEDISQPTFRYPYYPNDGRENLDAPAEVRRVVRGGAFWNDHQHVRCASRLAGDARAVNYNDGGFRVVVRP